MAEHPGDYARAFDALQQKRTEWGVAKAGKPMDAPTEKDKKKDKDHEPD